MLKSFILDMVNFLLIARKLKYTVPRTTNCPIKEEQVVFGCAHITTERTSFPKSMITFALKMWLISLWHLKSFL